MWWAWPHIPRSGMSADYQRFSHSLSRDSRVNRRVSRAKSRRVRCRTRPALSEPCRHHDAEGTRLTRGREDRPAGAAREREREVARVLQVLREERHADAGSFVTDACVQQLVGRLSTRVVLEALARARDTEPIEAGVDVAEPRDEVEPFQRPGDDVEIETARGHGLGIQYRE